MNTGGVKTQIDITATGTGLDQQINQVIKLNTNIQQLAKTMSQTALAQEKLNTQMAKTATEQAKTATQYAKEQGQLQKNSALKEQNALKTEKLRIQVEKMANAQTKSTKSFSIASLGLTTLTSNINNLIRSGFQVSKNIYDLAEVSADYVETLNLFEVALGDASDEATNFVNEMSSAFNINDADLMSAMGTFNLLSKQMGLTNEQGLIWSKTLTQLAVDTSSLRNATVEEALKKLRAGIVGETEGLRQWGIDVTDATLKQEALANGITKSFYSMSYAEKSLLRYSAILRQTTADQGDFARTLDSPRQLMKQFTAQTQMLARALGDLFIPIVAKATTYVTAFIMVLKEIAVWLATILGIDISFGNTALNSAVDSADSLVDSLGTAVSNAKELKKWLGGYDELNNVSPQTDSGSSGTSGTDLGIDSEFLKLLQTYDNGMGNVKNKIVEIRDEVMEWLGFSKRVNDEGETTFEWTELTGGSLAVILGTLGLILLKVINIVNTLKLPQIVGGLGTVAGKIGEIAMKSPMIADLGASFEIIGEAIGECVTGTMSWSELIPTIAPALGTIAVVVGGVALFLLGIKRIVDGIIEIVNGDTFKGVLQVVEGIALVVAGIALLMGGWIVAIIAGIVAVVVFLGELIYDNWDAIKGWFGSLGEWFAELGASIGEWFAGIGEAIGEFFTNAGEWFVGLWEGFNEKFITPIVEWFAGIAQWIYENVIQPIINFFQPIIDAILSVFATIGENIWAVLEKIGEIFLKIIEIFVALAVAFYDYVIKPVIDTIGEIVSWIIEKVTAIKDWIVEKIGEAISWLVDKITTAVSWIIEKVTSIATWIYEKIIQPIVNWLNQYIITPIKNFINSILEWVSSAVSKIKEWFVSIVNHIVEKFNSIKEKILNVFKGIVNTVIDFVGNVFKSTLNTVFAGIENIVNTFIRALNGAIRIINKIPGVNIKSVSELKLKRFDEGGIPDIGSMFVAGEGNNTEFVGNIGGRTNVVNQNQLESAMYNALMRANRNSDNEEQTVNEIYIGGSKTDTILERRRKRRANITGRTVTA